MKPFRVTVVLRGALKPLIFRGVTFEDAMSLIEGRTGFRLIFGDRELFTIG